MTKEQFKHWLNGFLMAENIFLPPEKVAIINDEINRLCCEEGFDKYQDHDDLIASLRKTTGFPALTTNFYP